MSEFRFKKFIIKQDKTAMKVSTDGVLLGAWVEHLSPKNILDIGTGTGLLAIMMAQKYPKAKITAVEIDTEAFTEAQENVNNCQWKEQIKLFNTNFIDFSIKDKTKYDLIISNPPYFENHLQSPDAKRNIARHTDTLPFEKLISSTANLISSKGLFSVIIPFYEANKFIHLCAQNNLFLNRKTEIFPNEKKKANRILIEFSQKNKKVMSNSIFIKKNKEYSTEYLELTKKFYLFAN